MEYQSRRPRVAKTIKISASMMTILFFLILLMGCEQQNKSPELREKKEMLIFCGITMIKPMLEIARIIEVRENVRIVITKGGSGNQLKSLLYTQTGDLYLPGTDKYYEIIERDYPGIILETVFVGHNKAAIMVRKGNPMAISGDLLNFTRREYAVVIGNANSGSIGKETQSIFERKGIYDLVLQNAMKLTTDSKDLVKVLLNKEADLVINWYAVSTWDENKESVEVMEIDSEFVETQKLILGLLKYSQNREIARKFMQYASSEKGKIIFKKHGLYFEQEIF